LGVGLLLVWVLAYMERRRAERSRHPQPMYLYMEALATLRVGWLDRWFMWRLARTMKLEHPTVLLITSASFDQAVKQYCRNRSIGRDTLRRRFKSIRYQLFG
jgi:hypothetical protein